MAALPPPAPCTRTFAASTRPARPSLAPLLAAHDGAVGRVSHVVARGTAGNYGITDILTALRWVDGAFFTALIEGCAAEG